MAVLQQYVLCVRLNSVCVVCPSQYSLCCVSILQQYVFLSVSLHLEVCFRLTTVCDVSFALQFAYCFRPTTFCDISLSHYGLHCLSVSLHYVLRGRSTTVCVVFHPTTLRVVCPSHYGQCCVAIPPQSMLCRRRCSLCCVAAPLETLSCVCLTTVCDM